LPIPLDFADLGAEDSGADIFMTWAFAQGARAGNSQGRRARLSRFISSATSRRRSQRCSSQRAWKIQGHISTAYIKDRPIRCGGRSRIKAWAASWTSIFRTATRPTTQRLRVTATAQTMVQVLKQCGDDLTREN